MNFQHLHAFYFYIGVQDILTETPSGYDVLLRPWLIYVTELTNVTNYNLNAMSFPFGIRNHIALDLFIMPVVNDQVKTRFTTEKMYSIFDI